MGTIVVTGATGALGSVVVQKLLAQGDQVLTVDRPRAAARVSHEPEASLLTARAIDLQSLAAWRELLDELPADRAPTGAVLVAGGWKGGEPLHREQGEETWRAMLDSNLETARVALQALLPGMVERKLGSIVVVGSRAVERPWESSGAAAYAAAKGAVVALIKAVAAEVVHDGVRVNAVLPSTIDTAANRASMPKADFSRWVTPESLSGVISFLLSAAARDVSGAAIPVYGRA